nr:uncharacterized protein LOC109742531 [Aegilops tauschii subsp. strangulata]
MPTAPGGGSKHRGVLLFGSHPKKPKHSAVAAKNTAAATKRREAAVKAVKFQKAPKQPPMVSAAPLSLKRSTSSSVVRVAEGSTNNRRIDPAADLREGQERNAREVREEKEAAAKKAEADKAAAAKAAQVDADAAAQAQADAAVKKRAEDAPVREREGDDAVLPEVEVPPRPPTVDAQGSQPAAPLVTPAGGELVVGSGPTARTPVHRRVEKAASVPRPTGVGSASSTTLEAEATSAAPAEWVHGGGTSALIKAAQDVQADFKAKAAALLQCMKAFVKTRATVRDYHNIRAATFNAHVRELDRRTADLTESRTNTALRAKEDECNKAAQERDCVAKELKDQAELHKAALKQAADNEARLLGEFETKRTSWADTKAVLTAGYGRIEDIVDDFFPGNSVVANQAIEARREERRAEGAEIAADAPRTLGEQLLSIQARLQPAIRMLRQL